MSDVVILGAQGRLGAMIAAYAKHAGLGWKTQARRAPADIVWSGDMDSAEAKKVFRTGATLVNMIGATSGDATRLHDANARFVEDLLAASAKAGVGHVILCSSAAIYGRAGSEPCRETDAPTPITPYGDSKAAMERIAKTLSADKVFRASGVKITVLRIGNVAGADALLAAAERHTMAGTPMPLHRFEDGAAATRSYIGPRDLFEVIRAAITSDVAHRTINVVHLQAVTLDDLSAAYRDHLLPDLTWQDTPAPETVPPVVTLSADKVSRFVPFSTLMDPTDDLAAQVVEYRSL